MKKQYHTRWCLALAAAAFLTSVAAGASPDVTQLNAVDHLFARAYAAQPLGSLTVGVVRVRISSGPKATDSRTNCNRTPATPDTVYRIGSVTKQFTAVMLLQLVERGKVRLSDPVVEVLSRDRETRRLAASTPDNVA